MSNRIWIRKKRNFWRRTDGEYRMDLSTNEAIEAFAEAEAEHRAKHPPLPVRIHGGVTGMNPPAKRRSETFRPFPLLGILLRGRARRAG